MALVGADFVFTIVVDWAKEQLKENNMIAKADNNFFIFNILIVYIDLVKEINMYWLNKFESADNMSLTMVTNFTITMH